MPSSERIVDRRSCVKRAHSSRSEHDGEQVHEADEDYPVPGSGEDARRIRAVLERAQTKALPLLNKGVELTPAAQVCCGACRTCLTTNVVTLAVGAITGAAIYAARLARRTSFAGLSE